MNRPLRIGQYLQTAFRIIDKNGGSYPIRDIMNEVEKKLTPPLTDYEQERYPKTGYIRWQSLIHFYSVDCTKANWLIKNKGIWSITPAGKKAINLPPEEFTRYATEKYREWKKANDLSKKDQGIDSGTEDKVIEGSILLAYEQSAETARNEIKEYIIKKEPYEFQDLCAALLRGMGYYTPFIASKGPDGGIDIIAYKDPLGAEGPRIKVQVKHRPQEKVSREVVASLAGIIRVGETGLIMSSGGFAKNAINEMRNANFHIESIDLDNFITLWDQYYDKLSEEDRVLLPLRRISFLAPQE